MVSSICLCKLAFLIRMSLQVALILKRTSPRSTLRYIELNSNICSLSITKPYELVLKMCATCFLKNSFIFCTIGCWLFQACYLMVIVGHSMEQLPTTRKKLNQEDPRGFNVVVVTSLQNNAHSRQGLLHISF